MAFMSTSGHRETNPDEPIPGDLLANRAGAGARQMAHKIQHAPTRRNDGTRWADVDRWLTGAEGEEATAAELSRLPSAWTVLHDITVGSRGANLDHVVIGPAGVFVINTKHRPNANIEVSSAVRVNGHHTNYISACEGEAAVTAQRLEAALRRPVPVTLMLMFVGHSTLTDQGGTRPVQVGPLNAVVDWLLDQPEQLDGEDVDRIAWLARHPDVWLPPKGHPKAVRRTGPTPRPVRREAAERLDGEPTSRRSRGTKSRPRRQSSGAAKSLVSLLVTGAVVYGLIQVAPRIGDFFASTLTDVVSEAEVFKKDATTTAATNVFVPAVRKQFPVITNGVLTPRLASIATYTCATLSKHETTPNYDTLVNRHAEERLRGATPTQVRRVLKTATVTTCPNRSHLLDRAEGHR